MKLINRSTQSPLARQACDIALAAHQERYGDYGRSKMRETYTVRVEGVKVWVEVVNRKASYVATAMTGMRRLRSLPGRPPDIEISPRNLKQLMAVPGAEK